ncbi:MAG: hypothetical protein H6600_00745 [Flavobacteriales bacterium]|nr:hypothetical protein [Flavobacteriales bacterium]
MKKINLLDQKHISLSIFLIGIIAVLYPIFSMDYLITLDGPNHIYSAKIFGELISGNSFYSTFININDEFVPNYLTVAILYPLIKLFGTVIGLKLFHLLHIALLLLGGTYAINSDDKNNFKLPTLLLPFVYSYLFFSGFYNFCFAASFTLFTIGYYDRVNRQNWTLVKYIIISVALAILYFSHVIPFLFAGLYIFIDLVVRLISSKKKKSTVIHILKIGIGTLPILILAFLFAGSRNSEISFLELKTLISRLTTGFSIVIKNPIADYFKLGFILMLTTLFINGLIAKRIEKHIFITILTTFLLYFILPDSVGFASVFSVRIEYILWLFMIVSIEKFEWDSKFLNVITGVLTLSLLIFQVNQNQSFLKTLNSHAKSVASAAQLIDNNSTVYPIFNSLVWDDLHISNLAGMEKDLIIFENTQARQDYFPIIYNQPYEDCLKTDPTLSFGCNGQYISIDYILVIGKLILEKPEDINLYKEAMEHGEMIYADPFVQLIKVEH